MKPAILNFAVKNDARKAVEMMLKKKDFCNRNCAYKRK